MTDFIRKAAERSANTILDFMRFHALPQWPAEDYWWFGLIHFWSSPWWLFPKGGTPLPRLTTAALGDALADLDVEPGAVKKIGAHTLLELDHLAYVYREKRYKDGRRAFLIAPHLKGERFSSCAHTFIEPHCSALELAQGLIDLDRAVPEIKAACKKAYHDGLQEKRIREIKLETARVFIHDYFHGQVPESVVSVTIADSFPGAADLLRVVVQDKDTPQWRTRLFDIPYDLRDRLQKGYIETFLGDPDLDFGTVAVRGDGESAAVSLRSYGA